MDITIKELHENKSLMNEHGVTLPIYTYDDIITNDIYDECIMVNYVEIKTAQEVYSEWVENKDKPVEPPVDQMEILQGEVTDILEYTLDLDYRLANIELFM